MWSEERRKQKNRITGKALRIIATSVVAVTIAAIAGGQPANAYTVETKLESLDQQAMSLSEIWLSIWNDVSSYNDDNADIYGGGTTFCDSKDMKPMQNAVNDADNANAAYSFFHDMSPMYCGNSDFVWRCSIEGPVLSGTTSNVYKTTCDPPSQEDIDNGTAMTAAAYQQQQSDAGITDDDLQLDSDDEGGDDGEDNCEANFSGFGWIFCPGRNLLTELIDGLVGFIADSMKWTLLADQSASGDNGIRSIWQNFLTIANVVFVIAFLIMIYSMATSTGLSNYDIKKMLPRLIIVAIAVNISFYICAALVDLSNIAGSAAYSLLYSNSEDGTWDLLAYVGESALSIVVTVLCLFLFGGAAIVALAVIVVCVAFRQVALVILVAISPIAIALYVLPNTKKWAHKWFDMFARLLIIYPAFSAIWGAARLVSNIFATNPDSSPIPVFVMNIVCAVVPAVAIIPLFKMSGGVMAMAAGAVSGAAARTGIANRINRAGRGAVKNNAATRGVTRRIGRAAGAFGASHIDRDNPTTGYLKSVRGGISRWAGRKAVGLANAAGTHAQGIDSELLTLDSNAMNVAKTNIAKYTPDQLKSIVMTGTLPNGREADQYAIRAAAENNTLAKAMGPGDVEAMMTRTAQQAAKLRADGRTREAQSLLNATANLADSSGAWLGTPGDLNRYRNLSGEWTDNASQAYNEAVSNYAGGLSAEQASNLSRSKHEYLQSKVNGDNAIRYGNSIRQALNNTKSARNMNQSTREQLSGYLGKMDAEIETVRRQVSGENLPTALPAAGETYEPPAGQAGGGSDNNTATQSAQATTQTTQSAPTTPNAAPAGGTTTASRTVNTPNTSSGASARSATSQQPSNYQPSRTMPSPATQQRSPMQGSGYSGGKHFAIDPQTNTRRQSQTNQTYTARHFSQSAPSPNGQSAPQTSGQWNQPNRPN